MNYQRCMCMPGPSAHRRHGTPDHQPNKPSRRELVDKETEEHTFYCSSHTRHHHYRQYEERSRVQDWLRIIEDPVRHVRERRRRKEREREQRARCEEEALTARNTLENSCRSCGSEWSAECENGRGPVVVVARRGGLRREASKGRRDPPFQKVRFAE
ncbi:hypothetical protein BGZ63DRAFT_145611 [Mariannaea sp. PMI_226]|nr:hypothetical protein BGZ63DRAFT_145611 [Mariannaea sp. PMI_226]